MWSDQRHDALHATATRLWKHLPPEDRLAATNAFFEEIPTELAGIALGALVKARHMRPQAARKLPPDAQARILASVLDPGEPLAQGLLVALHLAERRPLLGGLPRRARRCRTRTGVLKEESRSAPPVDARRPRAALAALASFPPRARADVREHAVAAGPGALGGARARRGGDRGVAAGAGRAPLRPRPSSIGCWISGSPSPEGRNSQNRSAW